MGACCSMRDRPENLKDGPLAAVTTGSPPVLHVLNGKKDYRLTRVLRLLLEVHRKTLEVRETSVVELPGGNVHPVLEYEGRVLSGETAIAQYVARIEGCYSPAHDPLTVYDVESLIAEIMDLWEQVSEGNEETASTLLPAVEQRLGSDGAHFAGGGRSLADVYVYDFLKKCFAGAKLNSVPSRLATFLQKFEAEQYRRQ